MGDSCFWAGNLLELLGQIPIHAAEEGRRHPVGRMLTASSVAILPAHAAIGTIPPLGTAVRTKNGRHGSGSP